MAFVYILECGDGSLYTGWTLDLDKRVRKHNEGKASKYTRSRRPVILRYFESYDEQSVAMGREAEIKRLKRIEKLSLIEGFQKEEEAHER